MPIKKILITVTTYPLPSRSYDELVCTAGILEDGTWIRVYPVPLSWFKEVKKETGLKKYSWVELDVVKAKSTDFRPESYSPKNYNIKIIDILSTKNYWKDRKKYCLYNVYTNKDKLIEDSKSPKNLSLATFKPTKIVNFLIEEDDKEWKDEWKELRKQKDLFLEIDSDPEKVIPKIPYKFYYQFIDDMGKKSKLMIEDWEIFELYRKCLKITGNQEEAIKQVKKKYFDEFTTKNDIYLFLGTNLKWHRRRGNNPFVIIGIFYPLKEQQFSLDL